MFVVQVHHQNKCWFNFKSSEFCLYFIGVYHLGLKFYLDLDIFLLSSNASTYECQTIYIVLVWLDFSFYATYLEYLMTILYMFDCTLVNMTNLCIYKMSRRGSLIGKYILRNIIRETGVCG
jgi:hypothetical protein